MPCNPARPHRLSLNSVSLGARASRTPRRTSWSPNPSSEISPEGQVPGSIGSSASGWCHEQHRSTESHFLHAIVHVRKPEKLPRSTFPVEANKSWLMKCELRTQNQRICLHEAKGTVVAGLSLDKIRQPDPEGQQAFVLGGFKFFGG